MSDAEGLGGYEKPKHALVLGVTRDEVSESTENLRFGVLAGKTTVSYDSDNLFKIAVS